MQSKEFEIFLGKKIMLVRIVWAALFINMLMLFVALAIVNKSPMVWDFQGHIFNDPMVIVLTAISFASALISLKIVEIFRNKIDKRSWRREDFINKLRSAVSERGQALYSPEQLGYLNSLDTERLNVFRVFSDLFPAFIIQFVLIETIAIFGFVLAIVNKNNAFMVPFGIVGVVLMAVSFPKFDPSKKF